MESNIFKRSVCEDICKSKQSLKRYEEIMFPVLTAFLLVKLARKKLRMVKCVKKMVIVKKICHLIYLLQKKQRKIESEIVQQSNETTIFYCGDCNVNISFIGGRRSIEVKFLRLLEIE